MDVKQEPSDPDEPMIKTETVFVTGEAIENDAFSRKRQIFKNEREDVNDSDNIFEIKQEVIKCEVSQIQQSSTTNNDSARENVGIFNTFIKKEIEDFAMDIHEVKATDMFVNIGEIKQDICEFAQPKIKSELLTSHCDLPTLKDENVYPDYFELEQPCSSKQAERISTSLKSTAKRVSMRKKKGYPCPVCLKNFSTSRLRLDHFCRHFEKRPKTPWSTLLRKVNYTFRSAEYYQVCCYCGRFLPNKSQFLRHFIVYHYVKKLKRKSPLQCKYCLKVFSKLSLLNNHKTIHCIDTPFKCEICSKHFSHNSSLKTHLGIHTSEVVLKLFSDKSNLNTQLNIDKDKPFCCEICPKRFAKKPHLKRHLIVHSGQKPFRCEVCWKRFARENHLNQHFKIHIGEKQFECETCSKQFINKSCLKRHTKIHTGEKPFKCEMCSNRFSHKHHLNEHFKIHTGEKPFKCEICSKRFSYKSNLTTHSKLHTGEKPFKCDICSKQFSYKSNLASHVKLHTREKPFFKCEICSKEFTRKNRLKIHLESHREKQPFKCELCSKQFMRKTYLNTHLKIHTGEKSFKCEICCKNFSRKCHLKSHLNIHTGINTFKCEICLKQFNFKCNLERHLKKHKN